jgi:hypothetical protein
MYRTQYVLNGDPNAWSVAGNLDVDGLGISLVALQRQRWHRWMHSRGGHFFLRKVVIGIDMLANLELEEILRQYWVYDERD